MQRQRDPAEAAGQRERLAPARVPYPRSQIAQHPAPGLVVERPRIPQRDRGSPYLGIGLRDVTISIPAGSARSQPRPSAGVAASVLASAAGLSAPSSTSIQRRPARCCR